MVDDVRVELADGAAFAADVVEAAQDLVVNFYSRLPSDPTRAPGGHRSLGGAFAMSPSWG